MEVTERERGSSCDALQTYFIYYILRCMNGDEKKELMFLQYMQVTADSALAETSLLCIFVRRSIFERMNHRVCGRELQVFDVHFEG